MSANSSIYLEVSCIISQLCEMLQLPILYSPRSKQVILLLTPHSDILFWSITIFKSLWVPSFQINTFYTHDQTRSSPHPLNQKTYIRQHTTIVQSFLFPFPLLLHIFNIWTSGIQNADGNNIRWDTKHIIWCRYYTALNTHTHQVTQAKH